MTLIHYLIQRFRRIKPADTKDERAVLARLNEKNQQAAVKAQTNLTGLLTATLERNGQ